MSNEMKFYLCFAGLCLLFPPLIGLAIGTFIFFGIAYIFYKLMGG